VAVLYSYDFTATWRDDDKIWELHAPIRFKWRDREYEIPIGTRSDLCSIPRVPILYMCLGGKYNVEGFVHDWLYQTGLLSKDEADRCLYVMITEHSGKPKLGAMYYQGVKKFGWKAWNDHRSKDNARVHG
jgi:hypothetical protein